MDVFKISFDEVNTKKQINWTGFDQSGLRQNGCNYLKCDGSCFHQSESVAFTWWLLTYDIVTNTFLSSLCANEKTKPNWRVSASAESIYKFISIATVGLHRCRWRRNKTILNWLRHIRIEFLSSESSDLIWNFELSNKECNLSASSDKVSA